MKKNPVLFLLLIVMIVLFTGCEQSISFPKVLSETKGYYNECLTAIMEDLQSHSLSDYSEGNSYGIIEDGLSYHVDSTGTSDVHLTINIENWVTSDGTELSGTISMVIYYDSATQTIIGQMHTTNELYYGSVYTTFTNSEITNGESTAGNFSIGYISYVFESLTVEGEIFLDF
jgi:hypothetical protein